MTQQKIYSVVNQQLPCCVECPSGYILNLNEFVDMDHDEVGYYLTTTNCSEAREICEEDYNFLKGALLDND